jgi:hypothetical protein
VNIALQSSAKISVTFMGIPARITMFPDSHDGCGLTNKRMDSCGPRIQPRSTPMHHFASFSPAASLLLLLPGFFHVINSNLVT